MKLNDFNLCHFLRWNPETQEVCPFKMDYIWETRGSPEEYLHLPEDKKVRVEINRNPPRTI